MDEYCLKKCKERFEQVHDAIWHGTDLYWNSERCVCVFEEGERDILAERYERR